MINSIDSTKRINSFEFVAIPTPRDVFRRYGERLSENGVFTCGNDSDGMPQIVNSSSTIDSLINAQRMLEAECKNKH